jgi:branched-chain amino acid transport system ATP-binding protein
MSSASFIHREVFLESLENSDRPRDSSLLEIKDLHKNFGRLAVISYLNARLEAGQLTSIIGQNGAGKTTLFNLITGRFPPSRGQIFFKGKDITGLPPYLISRMGLSRSFQISNVFFDMTVAENIRLANQSRLSHPTSLFISKRDQERLHLKTDQILESTGLAPDRDKLAKHLSHGDRRRLEIAMTLALDPELLLLDEPTSGLSPAETIETMNLIQEISKRVTILLIEHDMNVVMTISRKIVVMNFGRKIAEGTPREVEQDPEVRRVYLGDL